ncbi:unnamed protein product [Peniophora sp. CBMAI 1063]|nr:unnamed protein product [Peniophora sp. CBMAI 1063]
MILDYPLRHRVRDCVSCPSTAPPCDCPGEQQCYVISQSCNACTSLTCISDTTASSHDGISAGVIGGVIAGAIVSVLLLLSLFILSRRRRRQHQNSQHLTVRVPEELSMISAGNTIKAILVPVDPFSRSQSDKTSSQMDEKAYGGGMGYGGPGEREDGESDAVALDT